MKKIGVVIFSLIFLISFFSFISPAIENTAQNLNDRINNLQNAKDSLSNREIGWNYLKQEWIPLLEQQSFWQFLLILDEKMQPLSPVFKLFIGVEYSLSWIFFLSLFVYIALIIGLYKPAGEIFPEDKIAGFLVVFIIITIAGNQGIIQKILYLFLPFFTSPRAIIISAIIAVILLIIYSKLVHYFWKKIEKQKEKSGEDERKRKKKEDELIEDAKFGIRR